MNSRRTFLKLMAAAAAGLALPVVPLPKRRGPVVSISDEPIHEGYCRSYLCSEEITSGNMAAIMLTIEGNRARRKAVKMLRGEGPIVVPFRNGSFTFHKTPRVEVRGKTIHVYATPNRDWTTMWAVS